MLMMLCAGTVTLTLKVQPAKAATITVPDDYSTIQAAINAASPEDTILVRDGTYYENLVVNKSLMLIGEEKETTIIDGNGTGTVVQIDTDDASIANFTVRNGGYGNAFLDSCIYSENHSSVSVENNIILNAANGIIFYGLSNSTMRHNLVEESGLMGLHLDGGSSNCTIEGNIVRNCLEGIELERCSGNVVEDNQIIGNNASLVLNDCTGQNRLRMNSMTSGGNNIIVWGRTSEAFIQNIDTSNTANNKTIYYITNSQNLLMEPSSYPNMGFLAIVNCTNITVNAIDLSFNKDGLLMANSSNCNLINITVTGNTGPLLYGGLTFFKSSNNLIVQSNIINNSVAVCLSESNGNIFSHNAFVDNDVQVICNFASPFVFVPIGPAYSMNRWDSGYPSGGNYWSDYIGRGWDAMNGQFQNETGPDGIGDIFYPVTNTPNTPQEAFQSDNYPLMGMFYSYNVSWIEPGCNVELISNSSVSAFDVALWIEHPEVRVIMFNVTGETGTAGFCRICIPTVLMNGTYKVSINGTEVSYNLLSCSNETNSYLYFNYTHSTKEVMIVPEFSFSPILPLFMLATLFAVIPYRKRRK